MRICFDSTQTFIKTIQSTTVIGKCDLVIDSFLRMTKSINRHYHNQLKQIHFGDSNFFFEWIIETIVIFFWNGFLHYRCSMDSNGWAVVEMDISSE